MAHRARPGSPTQAAAARGALNAARGGIPAGKRPTVSACLIVKDEELNLPRCLASLTGAVDEIVVIDTGSSDSTQDLARSAGAKVFHFDWCDDFSAARNESLARASGDWLMWIDADEQLVESAPGALRDLAAAGTPWGYFIEQRSPHTEDESRADVVVQQWRLFPNRRGIHFEGRIHEHPVALEFIDPSAIGRQAAVHVHHWGYLPVPDVLQRKADRNRRLIELSLEREPEQPRHYFNLGMQLLAEESYAKAGEVLRRGIERWFVSHGADVGYVPGMFASAAKAAVIVGDFAGALELEATVPEEFVSSELLLATGSACAQLGRTDDAIARFNRAWSDAGARENILYDRTSIWRALLLLAQVYASIDRIGEAREALHHGLELSPGQPELLAQLNALPQPPLLTPDLDRFTSLGGDAQPAISACLIVKNEEANLPRILESLRSEVDEIIVVDTGSTDGTVEIARSSGAQVFHFPWRDDFSAARNASLSHASGDFIIWVDADDQLLPSSPGALRRLCTELPFDSWGYWVDVHCPTDPWDESVAILRQARMFRNHIGVRFHGRIHEQAAPPPPHPAGGLTFQSQVSIKHWGYVESGDVPKRRSERNRRLLELAIADRPDNHFDRYNLGLQYAAEREFEQALDVLDQAIALWLRDPGPETGFVPALFSTAAMAAVEIPNYEEALRIEALAPPQFVSAELLLHAGIAWWRLGHPREAVERFLRAVNDTSVVNPNVHDRSTATWRPLLMLACVQVELEEYEAAYEHGQRALQFAPTRPETLFILAHIARQLGLIDESLAWARRLLAGPRDEGYCAKARQLLLGIANERNDGALALEALAGAIEGLPEQEAIVVKARAHARLGDWQTQYITLDDGCRRFPTDPTIRIELSECLERQGAHSQALVVLAGGLEDPAAPAALYERMAAVLGRLGRLNDAANALAIAKARRRATAADSSIAADEPRLAEDPASFAVRTAHDRSALVA